MKNEKLKISAAALAVLASSLLLASCSMYDNYSEDAFDEYYGIGLADESESSSSVTEEKSSSSEAKNDTTYVIIVNQSSASEKSSSSSVEATSSSSSAERNADESSSSEKISSSSETVVSSSETVMSSSEAAVSSSSAPGFICGDSVMVRGGVEYGTVKIGGICWTAENLRYEPTGFSDKKGIACPANTDADCETYGVLYRYDAAKDACPDGWELPTKENLDSLHSYLTGKYTSEDAGAFLKSISGWSGDPGNGSNKVQFNGLPAGRCDEDGDCNGVGAFAFWWTSTESSLNMRYVLKLSGNSNAWYNKDESLAENYYASVRCVKK